MIFDESFVMSPRMIEQEANLQQREDFRNIARMLQAEVVLLDINLRGVYKWQSRLSRSFGQIGTIPKFAQ